MREECRITVLFLLGPRNEWVTFIFRLKEGRLGRGLER